MPEPRDLHRGATAVLSTILVLLGLAMIVRTLAAGGGGLALGLLLGVLFVAAGLGRLYINGIMRRGRWPVLGKGRGQPALFAIVYTAVASSIYFSLGVVADHALGLTPVVFLVAALFFGLAAMTYVEGAALHPERAGSTVFARYGFNELVSFIAGWAILLDYIILIAVTAFSATNYMAAFWGDLGTGSTEVILALGIVVYVALRNIRGFSKTRVNRISALVIADIGLQLLLIVIGLATFFNYDKLVDPINFGVSPSWGDVTFALGVATVVFTGLESAAGLSGEVTASRASLKRLIGSATAVVMVVYVGIGLVALTAFPVTGG